MKAMIVSSHFHIVENVKTGESPLFGVCSRSRCRKTSHSLCI